MLTDATFAGVIHPPRDPRAPGAPPALTVCGLVADGGSKKTTAGVAAAAAAGTASRSLLAGGAEERRHPPVRLSEQADCAIILIVARVTDAAQAGGTSHRPPSWRCSRTPPAPYRYPWAQYNTDDAMESCACCRRRTLSAPAHARASPRPAQGDTEDAAAAREKVVATTASPFRLLHTSRYRRPATRAGCVRCVVPAPRRRQI